MLHKGSITLIACSLILAACSPTAPSPDAIAGLDPVIAEGAQMDKPTETTLEAALPHDTAMDPGTSTSAPTAGTSMVLPAWYSASLTDARSGEPFTLNDFNGKVVLVETLAIWCSNCRAQQGQVVELHGLLGEREDLVSVGLDIDLNESLPDLKEYVERNGFDWYYSVVSQDVAREISQLYGDQFLNPPSTPMLIIDRHGQAHPLPFGIKSAAELLDALQPYLDESM